MDLSSKTVCVIDNGLFCEVAVTLAKSFGKVYLYTPWESAFPDSNRKVGIGLEGVTRVDHWSKVADKTDLFVFPDICYGELQEYLVKQGKRVWGSRLGEELEYYREFCKQVLKDVGLPVGPWDKVVGIDALREYLKKNENCYVKPNISRGDFETFCSVTYDLIEPRLDDIEHRLGPRKHETIFIVEHCIDDAVELAYDGFTIDGKFPTQAMSGIEIKGDGYVGTFRKYKDLPEPLRVVNDKLAPYLAEYKYRNFWAAETRITRDWSPYVIDPCCRFGSPPSELALLMYTNLAEVMWFGAEGEVVDPISAGVWGAEVKIQSNWADKNWQPVHFPPELREHVKLSHPTVIDGVYYTAPQYYGFSPGAVVAVGKTMEEAVTNVKKIVEEVKGFSLIIPVECFDKAEEEITKLKEFGLSL